MNKKMKRHAAMVSLSALGILSAGWVRAQTFERKLPRRPAYKEPECSTKSLTWPPLRRL